MATRQGTNRAAHKTVDIKGLRSKIDRLDREIVKLVNARADVASLIGGVKNDQGLSVYSPGREEEIIQNVLSASSGPLAESCLRAIFRELMSGSRALEKTLKVAYLGPEYSFSHIAAIERFGSSVEFVPVGSIQAVFESVQRCSSDFGIAPIENSTDGRISDTLHMFTRSNVRICAEVRLRVHHNLLAKCPQGEIRRVYSRPQALSQCRSWLGKNVAQAQLIEVISTATAAKLAQTEPHAAAVASRTAAGHYGLNIVASNIEDHENNITRFAVVGNTLAERSGRDKTAVLFQIPHRPGSLADALAIFKRNRINLTWIESFPSREAEQEYLFFVDLEGHQSESRVKRAIGALEKRTQRLVVLGSFPASECADE